MESSHRVCVTEASNEWLSLPPPFNQWWDWWEVYPVWSVVSGMVELEFQSLFWTSPLYDLYEVSHPSLWSLFYTRYIHYDYRVSIYPRTYTFVSLRWIWGAFGSTCLQFGLFNSGTAECRPKWTKIWGLWMRKVFRGTLTWEGHLGITCLKIVP